VTGSSRVSHLGMTFSENRKTIFRDHAASNTASSRTRG
jgi:hypothetical protein